MSRINWHYCKTRLHFTWRNDCGCKMAKHCWIQYYSVERPFVFIGNLAVSIKIVGVSSTRSTQGEFLLLVVVAWQEWQQIWQSIETVLFSCIFVFTSHGLTHSAQIMGVCLYVLLCWLSGVFLVYSRSLWDQTSRS